ncbi:MAG TPA: CehA/McbA family metallohydrolase [Armatimonadota bacterium]|jgi:hypothetical protein
MRFHRSDSPQPGAAYPISWPVLAGLLVLLGTGALPAFGADGADPPSYWRYRGCIHVHTRFSDGSGTMEQVTDAAQKAGLEFVVITDHNTLDAAKEGGERYWGNLLVLVGTEVSTDAGHVLALDVPPTFTWPDRQPQHVIDAINQSGGFGILAHPMSRSWLWTDWSVHGYRGIEVINLAGLIDDDLRSAIHGHANPFAIPRMLRIIRRYKRDPRSLLASISADMVPAERGKWDELLKSSPPMVGSAGVDAHARMLVLGKGYKVPTYQESFETVQVTVLTDKPLAHSIAQDRDLIFDAVRAGRLYMVYTRPALAPRFSFTATSGGMQATLGQELQLNGTARFQVQAPDHPHPLIRLLQDGKEIAAVEGAKLEWEAKAPGVYRAEVYAADDAKRLLKPAKPGKMPRLGPLIDKEKRGLRPWVFSNPIYLK